MKLITTNEQLTALLPNIAVTVQGEVPLFDKMAQFLSMAEKWVCDVFTSEPVFDTICSYAEASDSARGIESYSNARAQAGSNEVQENALRGATTQVVTYEAFRRAIPHLDVILTPNGFGIVSNTNIAPASKERITRLLDTLLDNRDAALSQVLSMLPAETAWLSTEQGKFFAATMFPNLEVTLRFPKTSESRWKQYLSIREKAIVIEEFFAKQYLSVDLMDVLRSEEQSKLYRSMLHQKVCRILKAVEIRCLQSTNPTAWMHFAPPAPEAFAEEHDALFGLVNIIRDNPEGFTEWHTSSTAELYNPPVFENKKESKGFWF